jgi:hypothetical protein
MIAKRAKKRGSTVPVQAADRTGMGSVTGIAKVITGNAKVRVW